MNTINVSLTISDVICANNQRNVLQKEVTITSSSQTIYLQCDYILNIVRMQDTSFTIILQNGLKTYIRNLFENETFQICLPCKNGTRLLSIYGIINN